MIDIPKITATINTEEVETVELPPIVSTIETRENFVELPKVVANIRQETAIVGNLGTMIAGKGKDGVDGKDGADGYTPVKGVDYFDGKDGQPGKDGYTPIKGIDYFDGSDGKDGIDGRDGKDGYTPVKGIDYFDGKDGQDGKNGLDGYTPVKGVDYFDGVDGRDGKDGKDGINGRTPIKGIDYKDGKDGKDGLNGSNGKDGLTPFINDDGHWQIGDKETGVSAAGVPGKDGEDGRDGADGKDGLDGKDGADGKSAYQYAVENGFVGTEQEFAEYLSKIKNLDELDEFEKTSNKTQDVETDKESETAYPSAKAVYKFGETVFESVSQKVNTFRAALDPATTQYIKDSGDFTYADVLAVENCKIEATYGNVTIIFNKEVVRNIQPDPVTGRYVEFSALLRNGPTTVKVFLFVYDPENLPTDPNSVAVLENWGDSQYCAIEVQHIVIGDFLDNDIAVGRYNTINAPSTKATGDYVDSQCGVVLEYVQTTFAQNIMALVQNTYGAHIIYNDPTGFEASNDDVGDTWHLTGLDLSPYKRLKFYVMSGGDSNANFTSSHIVEMHLDDRAKGYKGVYVAGHAAQNPNNGNRTHNVMFAVNAEKTSVQFVRATSLYGTASTNSAGGRRCYLIEGYLV
jgi:hypothetical protein